MYDGSPDATLGIADEYSKKFSFIRSLALPNNQGKGAALALGVNSARKKWVLLYDADGATPIQELLEFRRRLNDYSRILVGSRDVSGSRRIVKQPWSRHKMGRLFVFFRKWIVGMKDL